MDNDTLTTLRAAAKNYGDSRDVSAELQLVELSQSSVNSGGPRLLLRVFRFVPGESAPREYSNGSGYSPDAPDLQQRIERDIEIAARKLYETR